MTNTRPERVPKKVAPGATEAAVAPAASQTRDPTEAARAAAASLASLAAPGKVLSYGLLMATMVSERAKERRYGLFVLVFLRTIFQRYPLAQHIRIISSSRFLTTTDKNDVKFWQGKGGKGSKSSKSSTAGDYSGETIFVHHIHALCSFI